MSAVLRQGSGCRVDQVEGDELNHSQVALSLGADRAMLGLGLMASRKWNGAPSGFRAQREHVLGLRREQPGRPPEMPISVKIAVIDRAVKNSDA